jgi:hypothetical protein
LHKHASIRAEIYLGLLDQCVHVLRHFFLNSELIQYTQTR